MTPVYYVQCGQLMSRDNLEATCAFAFRIDLKLSFLLSIVMQHETPRHRLIGNLNTVYVSMSP